MEKNNYKTVNTNNNNNNNKESERKKQTRNTQKEVNLVKKITLRNFVAIAVRFSFSWSAKTFFCNNRVRSSSVRPAVVEEVAAATSIWTGSISAACNEILLF